MGLEHAIPWGEAIEVLSLFRRELEGVAVLRSTRWTDNEARAAALRGDGYIVHPISADERNIGVELPAPPTPR